MREGRGGREALRDKAGENCGRKSSWPDGTCAQSSGLPAWPPRPRPHFVLAKPIIAERERQLDEIRRSRMNIGVLRRVSYTPLA
jgi:hypothetical protein